MPTPPPLPQRSGIQYAHFEASKVGLHTASFDRERMEEARRQAIEWINQHPEVEVISIDSCFGNLLAIVTVWYQGCYRRNTN